MNKLVNSLRHMFLPHKDNQYRPLLIRIEGLALAVLALIFIAGFSNYRSTGELNVLSYATNITIGDLLQETNNERVSSGLPAFTLNSQLNSAALNKAAHMIENNYWAHVAPDGTQPWSFIDSVGYLYLKAGENLAYGFDTSAGTVDGWMASPGHRANILDADFTEVGFGILNGANYQGDENTVVVAMYALPYDVPEVSNVAIDNPDNTPTATAPASTEDEREDITEEPISEVITDESDDQPEFLIPENLEVVGAAAQSDPVLEASIAGRVISNFEALITGKASLQLYLTVFILLAIAVVFTLRHITAIKHYVVVGEHVLEGHPLLEAALLYTLIWLLLSATWGVIL